jgi:hypothetical protein
MIKIYVGGINAISGEPAIEDAGTKLRRQAKIKREPSDSKHASPLQDYVIVPVQRWLDGIADSDGTVRQFVAMPFGSGHSVEFQITGSNAAGGIQFEITPYNRIPKVVPSKSRPVVTPYKAPPHYSEAYNDAAGKIEIYVKTLTNKTITTRLHPHDTVELVKRFLQDRHFG